LFAVSFAKICHARYRRGMSTMNISLPESLKSFVDAQVSSRGFGTSSEYVRELIRKDQERLHLRELLLAGAGYMPAAAAGTAYFASLRDRVVSRTAARRS
jgi:antitoxin ParD1/3/4